MSHYHAVRAQKGPAVSPTLYIAGDSTAATYPAEAAPQFGWGQFLAEVLGDAVVNVAMPGASSKSFIDLGLLDRILDRITAGDCLVVSFGHNDAKVEDPARYTEPATTYPEHLSRYIDGARARGASPVLVTPVERRHFDSAGAIVPSHGRYPAAMAALAADWDVPLIDLTASSTRLWNAEGPAGTKKYFLHVPAGTYPKYLDGIEDNTHFVEYGAREVARLIAPSLVDRRTRQWSA
jgi:lysophospholipase L1-like esterase